MRTSLLTIKYKHYCERIDTTTNLFEKNWWPTSNDAISEIELEFLKFNENKNYLWLVGDFNSRTAKLLDFYEVEESNEFIYTNEFYYVYILDDLEIIPIILFIIW
jgi:hypothetical protein